jgi:hypothetical protein
MTGPEPKSADLIAAEPTTILPWELVHDVLRDIRPYWLASPRPARRRTTRTRSRLRPSSPSAPPTSTPAARPATGSDPTEVF